MKQIARESMNDAMVEESDESDASEIDDVPGCNQCMCIYLCIIIIIML